MGHPVDAELGSPLKRSVGSVRAARYQAGAPVPGRMRACRATRIERCTAMSVCRKNCYSSRAVAIRALSAARRGSLEHGRRSPTGAYLSPMCRGQ